MEKAVVNAPAAGDDRSAYVARQASTRLSTRQARLLAPRRLGRRKRLPHKPHEDVFFKSVRATRDKPALRSGGVVAGAGLDYQRLFLLFGREVDVVVET